MPGSVGSIVPEINWREPKWMLKTVRANHPMELRPIHTFSDYNQAKVEFVRMRVLEPDNPQLEILDVMLADFEQTKLFPILPLTIKKVKQSWWQRFIGKVCKH
jgi:hypothetical protein